MGSLQYAELHFDDDLSQLTHPETDRLFIARGRLKVPMRLPNDIRSQNVARRCTAGTFRQA